MKHIFLTLVISFILLSCRDHKHVNITGTKIFIIPPSGFEMQTDFSGLKKAQGEGIEAFEYPDSFYEHSPKDEILKGTAEIIDYTELHIDGYPAKLFHLKMDAARNGYYLLFGDSTFYVSLMSAYNAKHETSTGNDVKEALITIKYNKTLGGI